MAYNAQVIERAQARLAQAKEARESQARRRQAEAYAQVPRIKEIDIELRRSMARAAQAAFLQGSDGKDLLEQVRLQNLALQQERRDLLAAHFPPDWLDESPICSTCGGSGYIGRHMCECLKELCRQEQRKEISILSGNNDSFSEFRLEYYPDHPDPTLGTSPRAVMAKSLQICRQYAMFFSEASGNLLFSGSTGLGKTFLSACIARSVTDRGYSVVYKPAPKLFSALESARFSPTEENRREAENLSRCDLLIVDDLGTEMPGQFVTAALYSLLNDRILDGKPMVISTNLTTEEMTKRYSPQIASRLRGSFQRVPFVGTDIRVMKNRG